MTSKIVRYGVVSSIEPTTHAVRVVFEDEDLMVSDLLPVIVPCASKNQDYCLPDVGDRVVCLYLPNSQSAGFVVGSAYSQANLPPVNNHNKRGVCFADGTIVEYDRASSILTIDCKGSIIIRANGNVTVIGDVIADGISLKNHIHPESIGSVTGKPQ